MEERREKNLENRKIKEKDIILKYYSIWMKGDDKDYQRKLIGHPLLTQNDY
jgi:hypothetical protein